MICFGVIAVVIFGTVQAAKGLKVIEGDKSPSKHVYGTLSAIRTNLIDPDTPEKYHHKIGSDGKEWDLVFSDEFAMENRTFYPGDDQFWEAIQLHYAATDDKEYYDPDYVTTRGGSLRIRIDNKKQHDLNFTSGMLQGWNKMCFTQGYVETSIKQPGSFDSKGLWPAFWALGNLGRAGYMASTDGVWPYSYDSCDAGITANQSSADGLSFLPGQRLSSCTCKGEDHPSIGTARGAPEIDIMEGLHNKFAQSFNIAPFDIWKTPDYDFISIDNRSITAMNPFQGTVYQEAISALTTTNHDWFDFPSEGYKGAGHFHRFGMEYRSDQPNNIDNYINYYVNDQQSFRVTEGALHPDGNVGWRRIPKEPLSLILNLGLSEAWSKIDFTTIQLPTHFEIDYIRVYQPKDAISITCDPVDYPTTDYIKDHLNAYMNPNLTSWEAAGYEFPKNSLLNNCKV
ncbi:glycoside hydrolase family 16 protein [[Candida] arabinofermentans NRRL YB-2248]|uniref:Glycoside hydrolase family 16 protein n=1 Tax=[Candida] arabinofermentans NRRL YB-2248 TaxID=983967 RepID=A0A1E4T176_9ASCO|nr:glycoside hydrolase family 16 protein [[Candida] arabinofermentans NRRL YB-2248]